MSDFNLVRINLIVGNDRFLYDSFVNIETKTQTLYIFSGLNIIKMPLF